MERPWFQMGSRDWLDSKELRRCSPLARSILIDLMCLAHEGEPYGHLSDKAGPLTEIYMVSRCVVKPAQFRSGVQELKGYERLKVGTSGSLYIPRMVRDEEIRLKRAKGGRESLMSDAVQRPKDTEKDTQEGYPSEDPFSPTSSRAGAHVHVPRSDSDSGGVCSKSNPEGGDEMRFGTWEMDDSYAPLVELYRNSGKSLIDEDFESAWWKWKVLDFEQKEKRMQRFRYNIEHHCYSDPNFIPAPRKFVESEWKRELRATVNGAGKSRIDEVFDRA